MSDILIRGMDMPKHCGECGIDWCYIWRKAETPTEKRPSDCPLSEVPTPHGDLIDRDALVKSDRMVGKLMMYGGEYVYTQTEIDRAPTIIPASEEHTMEEFMYGQEGNPNDGSM